jgi:TrmH family RNA methyltransferase
MERLGKNHPRVRDLRRRVRDRRSGEVIVDGPRLIADLIRWRVMIRELYLADDTDPDPLFAASAEQVWLLDRSVFDGIAPTRHPQGMLAVADEPGSVAWDPGSGTAVYLDGLQDPGNVGAIIRTAAALGSDAVLLSKGCADAFLPSAVRASAGAVFRIPLERGVDAVDAARRVVQRGGGVWATGGDGVPVDRWRPDAPTLILLGSEGSGLGDVAIGVSNGLVTIPLERGVDSLNVAVAAAILLKHLKDARRRS